jgi:predicted TIM-barrel fold metal-dependent hydrolase
VRLFPGGAIDCDIHPAVPSIADLLPHLSDHWRETVVRTGLPDLETVNYPPGSPLTARADWRPPAGKPASGLDQVRREALDRWDLGLAICNCLYGVQGLHSEDLAAALCRGLNGWMAREWLDREPRLRASIVVPVQSVEKSVDEIEHWAGDRRFVQVLLLVSGDAPLGKRQFWPIYAAAARHGLAVGIHAGSSFRHPTTALGWTSYYTEDYVNQAQAFQTQLTSLICEGVFSKFPELRVVLIESGFTWLPTHMWHLGKFWKGLRMEVPWVDRPPFEIVRDQVRLTLQPVDGPPKPEQFERFLEHMGSDRLLLFSTDYPHWQFDGDEAVPDGLSDAHLRRILVDNPRETYARLTELVA